MELKPCPFCAGTDLHTTVSGYDFWVYCETCNAEGPAEDNRDNAINAWNDRHYCGDTREKP